jgi:hypothetical protein
MATEPDLYVGKEPATFELDGSPVFIGPTVVVRAGHPIMKGRESLFEPLVVHYDVEQAATSEESEEKTRSNPPQGRQTRQKT